jgi:protein-L-isoaspartate(D-aspartate) O-methyltransferase
MNNGDSSRYDAKRDHMVESQLRSRGIHDPRVLDAMLRVPRHEFVPGESRTQAYEDRPLSIGEEQTISQPLIIAISLQALALTGSESVLEIGTGSGYQTALLSLLAKEVHSVERHASLAQRAETTLRQLGFNNAKVTVGDGSRGWKEHAPYDAILVSAAAPAVPPSLVEQLADGGRMVVPVGPSYTQELLLIRTHGNSITTNTLDGCRFVPLVGVEGY